MILFRWRLSLSRILVARPVKRLNLFLKLILSATFHYFVRLLLVDWRWTLSVSVRSVLILLRILSFYNWSLVMKDWRMCLGISLVAKGKIIEVIHFILKLFRVGRRQLIIVRMQICTFHDHLLWVRGILWIFALIVLHQYLLLTISIRSLYLMLLTGTTVLMLGDILSIALLRLDLSDLGKDTWLRL